jgi:integrase
MTTSLPSRSPFADPALPTFADLLERLKRDQDLPKAKRQNWKWALKTVARAAAKDPAEIVGHPGFVRNVMQRAAPESIGLTRASWNNARSLLGKILEWAGLAKMPAHYLAPLAPAWGALMDRLPAGTSTLRFRLDRLAHYCSAQRINPDDVDDQVLTTFHDALSVESIVKRPYKIYWGAAKYWNDAADRIPGWPQQRLAVPSRKQLFTYNWDTFPASLEQDVDAYCDRALGLRLDDDHFLRAQRPATVETRRRELRVLTTAIAKSGIAPESLTGLPVLLRPETAAAGLRYLVDRNGGRSGVQISHIAAFLPTLARRLDMPDEAVARLRKMAVKLKVTQHGMSERNREALRAFDDEVAVRALVNLPARIVNEVRKTGRRNYREGKLIQTALAIELLLNAPVRIQNLASIELDRHLLELGTRRERRVHLRFPAHEVKNSADLEFPLMAAAVDLLDLYVAVWRPILSSGQDSPFLFPGDRPSRPKWKKTLSTQIKELVFAYTRLAMTAHRFRHAAAKIYLDRNPGQYEVVRQLLGHKNIQTTIAFYAGAETASAARHYARTILGIRDGEARLESR